MEGFKTAYYWQKNINSRKYYVEGLDWLLERKQKVIYLEVHSVRAKRKQTRVTAYLKEGLIYSATFDNYEEASRFVIQGGFNHSNKEIHSN